jgi:hypothetical protein
VTGQTIKTWKFVNARVGIHVCLFVAICAIPNCWFGFLEIFWNAGQPLFPSDFSNPPTPAFSGRRHHWRPCLQCPQSFFCPERGPCASAESCRHWSWSCYGRHWQPLNPSTMSLIRSRLIVGPFLLKPITWSPPSTMWQKKNLPF